MDIPTTELYFEAHVTIDPVSDEQDQIFKGICADNKFKIADLWMNKGNWKTEPWKMDAFCTGRDTDFLRLKSRMLNIIGVLQEHHIKVRRFKIENIILDSRHPIV